MTSQIISFRDKGLKNVRFDEAILCPSHGAYLVFKVLFEEVRSAHDMIIETRLYE
jgi:hypothetical protein